MPFSQRELPSASCPELPGAPDAQLLVAAFHYCVFTLGPIFIINRRSSAAALAGSLPVPPAARARNSPQPTHGSSENIKAGGVRVGKLLPTSPVAAQPCSRRSRFSLVPHGVCPAGILGTVVL